MSYATGPCPKCGHNEWGTRHSRYQAKDGTERVYESRYCLICSRRRTAARKQEARA